ncbi:MAG: hypothetical protein U0521_13410 [Anaerolineae bacterium]
MPTPTFRPADHAAADGRLPARAPNRRRASRASSAASTPATASARASGYLDLLLGYTFLGVIFASARDRRRARMWYADWGRI